VTTFGYARYLGHPSASKTNDNVDLLHCHLIVFARKCAWKWNVGISFFNTTMGHSLYFVFA